MKTNDVIKAIILMIAIFVIINFFLGDSGLTKFDYKIF